MSIEDLKNAIINDNASKVQELLGNVKINDVNNSDNPIGVFATSIKMLRILAKNGYKFYNSDNKNASSIHHFILNNNEKFLKTSLSYVKINDTQIKDLISFSEQNNSNCIAIIKEKENKVSLASAIKENEKTQKEKINLWQQKLVGDNVNKTLIEAVYQNDNEKLALCYLYGADVNTVDENGLSPLLIAAQQGNYKFFESLLNKGADPKVIDNNGNNLLHHSKIYFSKIIELGVDPNKKNNFGETPLHEAAYKGQINKSSVIGNISPESLYETNDVNVTPIDLAENQGFLKTADKLIEIKEKYEQEKLSIPVKNIKKSTNNPFHP